MTVEIVRKPTIGVKLSIGPTYITLKVPDDWIINETRYIAFAKYAAEMCDRRFTIHGTIYYENRRLQVILRHRKKANFTYLIKEINQNNVQINKNV